jgi:hypothetical protein
MQDKYHFRVWFNHKEPRPVVPFPWNVLFFWYNPSRLRAGAYHRDMPKEIEQAHIMIFLTSQKSITTGWIEQEEIPRAVERYQKFGQRYVRIFPLLVSPSQWKQHARLAAFEPLALGGKAINQIEPEEDAWLKIVEALKPVIEELRRNWMEEHKRLGLPTQTFLEPPPPWEEQAQAVVPLPNWIGYATLAALFWGLSNWYTEGCKPKHEPYYPKRYEIEDEYPRTPYQAPPTQQEVVPRDSAIKIIEQR